MALTSVADVLAARRQRVPILKTGLSGDMLTLAETGNPSGGSLTAGNTTTGVIFTPPAYAGGNPVGYPPIMPFDAGKSGYVSRAELTMNTRMTVDLVDRIFGIGAFSFGVSVSGLSTVALQRVPNSDYRGLMLVIEAVTAFTGNPTFTINYTDHAGNPQTTVVTATAPTANNVVRVPLITEGVQAITGVQETGASAGTFNVSIWRRILRLVQIAGLDNSGKRNPEDFDNFISTGLPQVYDTSALVLFMSQNSSGSRNVELMLEIVEG